MAKRSRKPLHEADPVPPWHPQRRMGLARALLKAGYGTRREIEAMVAAGRVGVEGETVRDPRSPVEPAHVLTVDGRTVVALRHGYFAFHKPARVVCAAADGPGRRLVQDFLPRELPGLRPVGRLDGKTTGLLLVSNDPAWIAAVTGNENLEQEYRLQVEGELTDLEIGVLTAGVHLPNLGVFRPRSVRIVERMAGRTVLVMVVREGKIRQVRRMFATLRHRIILLRRVRIGGVRLGDLAAGGLRRLTEQEVASVHGSSADDTEDAR